MRWNSVLNKNKGSFQSVIIKRKRPKRNKVVQFAVKSHYSYYPNKTDDEKANVLANLIFSQSIILNL